VLTTAVRLHYLILFAVIGVLRVVAASRFPIAGDEAYYWEWSHRLAFGYVDHPPMVAWTIALFDWGTHDALRLRAGFLLCGVVAAVAAFGFVRDVTGSATRAAMAALAVTITPLGLLAFNVASPDGPFLAMWMATLACALRAVQSRNARWWMLTGIALGFAALSRIFAVSLVPAIVWAASRDKSAGRTDWPGPFAAAVVAMLIAVPYIVWNADHDWAGLTFALAHRHHVETVSLQRSILTVAGALAAGALFLVPMLLRSLAIELRDLSVAGRLLVGSAAPLALIVIALSLIEPVELYWFAGPMLSLVVLAFIAPMRPEAFRRGIVTGLVPSIAFAIVAALLACAPASLIVRMAHTLPAGISTKSALEIYSDHALASAVRERYGDSIVVTDEYGLSSLLDFYAGIAPNVIGYNSEGREALRWLARPEARQMLYLDHVDISERPDMLRLLQRACGAVAPLPGVVVRQDRFPLHAFSLTRCQNFNSRSVAILNQAL
jgi:hypothetical protein